MRGHGHGPGCWSCVVVVVVVVVCDRDHGCSPGKFIVFVLDERLRLR